MDKIYYHSFKKKDVLLAKADGKCSFILNCNADRVCFVMFTNNGYFLQGSRIKGIEFYKKGTTFYIVNTIDSDNFFITIQPLSVSGTGSFETCYGESFDSTGYTKLEELEESSSLISNIPFSSSAYEKNTIVPYDLKIKNQANYAQCSLLLISYRKMTGIGGSGLVLVSSSNKGTKDNFSVSIVFSTENFDQFIITGTKTGINVTTDESFKFSVTEIRSNTII